MARHSVAEAKNRLSELIDLALRGEPVVITRHGTDTVQLRPLRPTARPLTSEDLDLLAKRRVGSVVPEDAGALIRRMRDDEQH
jgi:prevent-host-death family protein